MPNNNYGIFSECNLIGINEGLGDIIIFGAAIGLMAASALIDKKKRQKEMDEKEKEYAKNYAADCKKRYEDNLKFAQDAKKYYSITGMDEIDVGFFKDKKEVFNSILKDCKDWVKKIINSKAFEDNANELIHNEELMKLIQDEYGEYYKPSLSRFRSIFKVKEGIAGYEESIHIIDGSQSENVEFGWVCGDLSRMLEIKYNNYLSNISTGDGDEGHIYYTIKV